MNKHTTKMMNVVKTFEAPSNIAPNSQAVRDAAWDELKKRGLVPAHSAEGHDVVFGVCQRRISSVYATRGTRLVRIY